MSLWKAWALPFSYLPYGDPWIAAFGMVAMMIMAFKVMRMALSEA